MVEAIGGASVRPVVVNSEEAKESPAEKASEAKQGQQYKQVTEPKTGTTEFAG